MPQSRRQLWDIIRAFKLQGRTVLLTTHYMDEAERLCNRVAIVDQGKVIALGSPPELIAGLGGEHVVDFAVRRDGEDGDAAVDRSALESIPGVRSVRPKGRGFHLAAGEPHVVIPTLLEWLRSQNLHLSRLTTHQASLEDVFVNLTGRRLAEGEGPDEENGKKA